MSRPSIPDSIYNNRCRYCKHFTGVPNTVGELSTGQLFSSRPVTPCNIISIAEYCKQKILSYPPSFSCTYEVHTDECFSFTPNCGYPGICWSCRYFNIWDEKGNYCELAAAEIADRHPMLIGAVFYNNRKEPNSWTYAYHTCSKWQLSDWWYNTAIKSTAEGKLPKTWDPSTRKLIQSAEPNPKVLDAWEMIQKEIAATQNNVPPPIADDGQISFFDAK